MATDGHGRAYAALLRLVQVGPALLAPFLALTLVVGVILSPAAAASTPYRYDSTAGAASYVYDCIAIVAAGRASESAARSALPLAFGGASGRAQLGPLGLSASFVAAEEGGLSGRGLRAVCNCFPAGTKVATEHGETPIEKVKVGDKVWAQNLTTGKRELRKVVGLFNKHTDEMMTLTVAGATVDVTSKHPFYVPGRGWVMSGDLKIGDKLLQRNGTIVAITSLTHRGADTTVHNFEVEGDQNYYISEAQLLVHNCDIGETVASHVGERSLSGVPNGGAGDYIEGLIHNPGALVRSRVVNANTGEMIYIDDANPNIFIYQPMSAEGGTVFSRPSLDSARTYFDEFGR